MNKHDAVILAAVASASVFSARSRSSSSEMAASMARAGCGRHLPSAHRVKVNDPDYPTFDHIVARSKGGRRTLTNGVLKHKHCNAMRGDRPPTGTVERHPSRSRRRAGRRGSRWRLPRWLVLSW